MQQNRKIALSLTTIAILFTLSIGYLLTTVFTQIPNIPQPFRTFMAHAEFHCWIEHYRDGILQSTTYHAMTITDYGKDQMEKLLAGEDTNAFKYFVCSNSTDEDFASDTTLEEEITTDGLERALATYTNTGIGTWNMTLTWNVNGNNSTKLYGVCSESTGANLCLAEQQGIGNQKNLQVGDTLKMTVQGEIS